MRLVRIESVLDGMELARDIPSPALGGTPLLRRGVRLSQGVAGRLTARSIRAVWVEDGLGDGIVPAPPLPDHVRRSTEKASAACLDAARAAFSRDSTQLGGKAFEDIANAAGDILTALMDCPEAALALDDLSGADSYTYSHSVRVATLGMMLGQRMMRRDGWVDWNGKVRHDRFSERMRELGTGLLIHDIGKISIPSDILNKPGKLTAEEWDLMRTHPDAGASLLPPERVPALTIAVVRNHHERFDGLGYPRGKAGADIHEFARVAAVADVYDAVTADRPYKAGTEPHVGVKVICDGAGTQFDPQVVAHFRKLVMPYPVGHPITLPDGTQGTVSDVDGAEPERPTVRFKDSSGVLREAVMGMRDGQVLDGYDPDARPAPGTLPRSERSEMYV